MSETEGKEWWVVTDETESVAHVVPIADVVTHYVELSGECVCGPMVEEFECDECGCTYYVVTHHSLDAREYGGVEL